MNEIRVLLVDSELNDARFIQEALSEIEERTQGGAWVHCRVSHLERAEDATVVLETERPDILLFNPTLVDSRGLETFSTFHDAAPGVPMIALLDAGEEGLGRRMLRQGAQDFVIKSEVDCQPLARAMLNAIERQRFYRANQLGSAVDMETGFYNSETFRALAVRDIQLAREGVRPIALVLAELDNLVEVDAVCGREATHDMIVESANVVRAAASESALLARVGLGRFVMLTWQVSADHLISALQNRIQADHHSFAFVFGYATMDHDLPADIDELLKTAEAVLYENKKAYSHLN
jgi:two-component system cell cycle response regulator